jgi:hypothetical protein
LRREKNVAVNIVITTDEVAALYVPPWLHNCVSTFLQCGE